MRKFIIERNIAGAGDMSTEELHKIAECSNSVVSELDAPYHWIQSFVTGDRIYCVHIAPDEETVREHARRGGFPADDIREIKTTIDPTS